MRRLTVVALACVIASWAMAEPAERKERKERKERAERAEPTVAFAVTAKLETKPVPTGSDSADDIAIWVHPTDRSKSVVIGTNKRNVGGKGGLYVYGLDGKLISSLTGAAKMNNVDLRYGFQLGGKKVDVIAATNRTTFSIDLFTISPKTRKLAAIGSIDIRKELKLSARNGEPYGVCMYRSRISGKYYVLVSCKRPKGTTAQFELSESNGRIVGKLVRSWDAGSKCEGMVCDDRYGKFYISEENYAIYQYGAEPTDGTGLKDRVTVDKNVKTGGHFTAQVEGLTLFQRRDGSGYLIASSQGSNEFILYDRKTLAYLATFKVPDGPGSDGLSDSDGIDCVSTSLGSAFPNGLFVAHDGANTDDKKQRNQNYKFFDWADIMAAAAKQGVNLSKDPKFDPRAGAVKTADSPNASPSGAAPRGAAPPVIHSGTDIQR